MGYSQVAFEKGYFIDNNGAEVQCFIKNQDWKKNPVKFQYKLIDDETIREHSIESVKEFGVEGTSKYVRATVQIERSSLTLKKLSDSYGPDFKTETLFLKTLVEGAASLYHFEEGTIEKFFFKNSQADIAQLVYKKYISGDNTVGENNRYQLQLYGALKCKDIKQSQVENLSYTKKVLISFFLKFNECIGAETIDFDKNSGRDLLKVVVRPGLTYSNIVIGQSLVSLTTDYGKTVGFRLGLLGEFIMPFNNNKWSAIVEPNFQRYNGENDLAGRATYNSLNLPLGVRHSFFLNENSRIFINGFYVLGFNLGTQITERGRNFDSRFAGNVAAGIGFNHLNTYELEFRYHTPRNIFSGLFATRFADYQVVELVFGYTIF